MASCLCSDSVGWSDTIKFRTPPAAGSDELSFVIYGDMGKAPLDPSVEHYIQVGEIVASKQEMLQSEFFFALFIYMPHICSLDRFLWPRQWLKRSKQERSTPSSI